jgi:DNA-binding GntR family transcriptional regulator
VARASVRAAIAHLQDAGVVASEGGRRGTLVLTSWVPDELGGAPAPDHDRFRALLEGRFHRLMWRLAGNPPLERAMRDVYVELEAVLDMAMRTEQDTARSLLSHQRTLAALRRGEPAGIDAAMSDHLALMEGIYAEVTGRIFRS